MHEHHIREAEMMLLRKHHDGAVPYRLSEKDLVLVLEERNQQSAITHAARHEIQARENLGAMERHETRVARQHEEGASRRASMRRVALESRHVTERLLARQPTYARTSGYR